MPIFEYVCQGCGCAFEALIRGAESPACPECGATELERKFSVFGVGGSDSSDPGPLPAG